MPHCELRLRLPLSAASIRSGFQPRFRNRNSELTNLLKICDLTQFYSPLSGGVKRYVHEKINWIQTESPNDEHILVIPGAKTEMFAGDRSRIYSIRSPVVSRSARYRALLNLHAVAQIVERERPDIIESSDPYQVGWKATSVGRSLRIPVVGFYHSHFPEAHLQGPASFLLPAARKYVRNLYNRFDATLVPSRELAGILEDWGVHNVRTVKLGVNPKIFSPLPNDRIETRRSLDVAQDRKLLLYVGRLAPEKNTDLLFAAFKILAKQRPNCFALLVIGSGPEGKKLSQLQAETGSVKWIPYCTDSLELARFYRAADAVVHPGRRETFGLVALESQACGTPVIGIRGSRLDQIILHEQESWAMENTPQALASAIEDFFQKDLAAIGNIAAQAVAEQYSWPRVFDGLFCIYRDVCTKYREP